MPDETARNETDAEQAERDRTLREAFAVLDALAVTLPPGFRFSREEAHERGRDLPRDISAVLRFPAVTPTRQEFEASLGRTVDRFEVSRHGASQYAQINLQEGAAWADLVRLIETIGPAAHGCFQRGDIGQPYVDFQISIADGMAGERFRMPNSAASAIARWGFDLEVSTYLTSED